MLSITLPNSYKQAVLTVARKKAICRVLGPGERSIIWFHGCSKRCPGCIAGTMNETDDYETYTPEQLAEWVLSKDKIEGTIEGITVSGGEPLQQPIEELTEFLTRVKRNANLSVLCYTGCLYEDILADKKRVAVLPLIDVLIDGEYRQEEDFGQRWRGSANQRFHFLTDRYRSQQEEWNNAFERQIEIELDMQGKLLFFGVPSKDFIDRLTAELHKRDVDVDFS